MKTVIKVGGSLCRDGRVLEKLCMELSKLDDILIVPGGGEFANRVREVDREFGLSPVISHRLAILAMEQTGLLIRKFFDGDIFDCRTLLTDKRLKPSWDVTSDSIAAHIAGNTGAERLVLLKDVDGLFTEDPKKSRDAKLIPELTAKQLPEMKSSCLDPEFSGFVRDSGLEVWVLNGNHPERIRNVLEGKKVRGTRIFSNPA